VLEKRLGIAQLCLLLAVLVFMGLTRGSRGESLLEHGQATVNINKSVREWSRRHLSFSGDWANRFRSRSPTPQPVTRSPGLGKGEDHFIPIRAVALTLHPNRQSRIPVIKASATNIHFTHPSPRRSSQADQTDARIRKRKASCYCGTCTISQ
jgi:hypothetical protein